MRTGRKGLIREMKNLGSTEPVKWLKECIDIDKEHFGDCDIHHIRFTDIETFKKDIKKYSDDHPNSKVMASGFIYTMKED